MDYFMLGLVFFAVFAVGVIVGAIAVLVKSSAIKAEFDKVHARFDAITDALVNVGRALEGKPKAQAQVCPQVIVED